MADKTKIALTLKYRPKSFDEVCEQNAIKQILASELQAGNLKRCLLFTGGAGTGKAQPLYSKVLTPNGYITMGDISIGQTVFTHKGNLAKVTNIYPQGKRPIYEITLQDRTKIRVADNHLNFVYRYNQRKKCREDFVLSTLDLIELIKTSKYPIRIDTPAIDFESQSIFINPYLLGLLIGDGSLNNNFGFCNNESDIIDKMNLILAKDYNMILKRGNINSYDYSMAYINPVNHNCTKSNKGLHVPVYNYDKLTTLKGQLEYYGLLCKSTEKHIPREYLYNTKEIRLELLRGLIDTDGDKDCRTFSTSSVKLAEDFAFLVRSLGIRATQRIKPACYKGKRYNDSYVFYLHTPKEMLIFHSEKHKANYVKPQNEPIRNIKSIEYIGEEDCQCIMLDHEDHTYISNDFIPTHNTTNARIFANEIEPVQSNVMEINCADHTGVDDVRKLVIEASRVRPIAGNYKIFILDECFSGDTLVTTKDGYKQIKNIIPGEIVQHMNGYGKVAHVFANKVKTENLFFIKINGKSLLTTKDHLFFTNEGWVRAQDLKTGDILYDRETMSKLLEDVSDIQQQILQSGLFTGISTEDKREKEKCTRNSCMCNLSKRVSGTSQLYSENLQQKMYAPTDIQYRITNNEFRISDGYTETILRKNEEKQSQLQSRCSKKSNEYKTKEKHITSMERTKRWEWQIHDSSNSFMGALRNWFYSGICNSNRLSCKTSSVSYELQSRPCLSKEKIGDRGGWQIPSLEKRTIKRCQENGMLGKFRVESCEIFQRGYNEQLFRNFFTYKELNSEYVTMYDLQVEGHPSYYVNDVLVHNCHMLTAQSQNALLKVLEEPPAFCVFILCTTDPQKVLGTILSRAFRYDFQLISHQGIMDRLNYILEQEKLDPEGCGIQSWDINALSILATAAKGHMRDAITNLDKVLSFTKNITVQDVEKVLGVTSYEILFNIAEDLITFNDSSLINHIDDLVKSGMDLKLFVKNFLSFMLDINKYVILKSNNTNDIMSYLNIPRSFEQRLVQYTITNKPILNKILKLLLDLNSELKWETEVRPVLESKLLQVIYKDGTAQ